MLFPDWSRYLILRRDDLTQWSNASNYINHPSLYYLLLAPLMSLTSDPIVFRLVNMLLSTAALLILFIAVRWRFTDDVVPSLPFAIVAASFPKAVLIGGMVNNDNRASLAAAVLFGGILGLPGAAWWIMAGLAIAGWTKLTAFIGLATVAAAWMGFEIIAGRIRMSDRRVWLAALGAGLGVIPYCVTFARIGHLLWVNEAYWYVPIADRIHLDPPDFVGWFFHGLAMKWSSREYAYPIAIAWIVMLTPLALAAIGLRHRVGRPWTVAYAIGLIALVAVHLGFGWRSYVTIGDLTIVQTRYYNILWPGVALAAALAFARLGRRWRPVGMLALGICLIPTVPGTLIGMGIGNLV